jgi:hypothetical protein
VAVLRRDDEARPPVLHEPAGREGGARRRVRGAERAAALEVECVRNAETRSPYRRVPAGPIRPRPARAGGAGALRAARLIQPESCLVFDRYLTITGPCQHWPAACDHSRSSLSIAWGCPPSRQPLDTSAHQTPPPLPPSSLYPSCRPIPAAIRAQARRASLPARAPPHLSQTLSSPGDCTRFAISSSDPLSHTHFISTDISIPRYLQIYLC